LYGLMIVYASLEPFSGWMAPLPELPFFLFEPWPPRITRFDIAINVLAYAPFGFLLALVGTRRPAAARLATAIGAGALLSFAMESAQMFLPTRSQQRRFLCFHRGGGGTAALASIARLASAPHCAMAISRLLGGRSGDPGLALLGVWLLSQLDPGIPPFAATFDLARADARSGRRPLQAAQSAFNVIGVGLFLAAPTAAPILASWCSC
jgi:hypothetical protein